MKALLVLISLTLLPALSLASCEDGHSIAQSGVAGQLRKLDPHLRRLLNCKYTVDQDFKTLKNGNEVYTVISVCGTPGARKTSIYQVTLQETEDGVCHVKSIQKAGAQG